ncbi:large-conductance mechanosensitive channel [Haematobacter massiliensis]|uniref:Large-conductance mechanosensitive channel n=1 Tax=Haematobacter massiliensis TaxID=195105 RepID=A0A086Y8J2_9RHOB|nr:large-conductance mechanosensitive channel protein MscL [Haematobacter massiliensis]KFI30592.1 mechanosensitive ion channel protein MscL [Haematobacter massiliensis]OWJ71480.1 large-conductance mechanosensitive channel [Haematobacter massiliensis]OWJ87219.1 large-conductance mechanosensitive channel [Haematobacter massiliensis]QBJ25059.1 large-conductance mechanosensitive channel protein MscL [Haematobacter massiliensis]
MLKEFRDFIARGNVLDLAVGIIIGAAFTSIVNSVVADLINPIISLFTGGLDFSGLSIALGEGPNAAQFAYGKFIMAVINFLIIAWVVFLIVKGVNTARRFAHLDGKDKEEKAEDPPEIKLLTEIRDELKNRPAV